MIRRTMTTGLSLSVAATGLLLAGPAGSTASATLAGSTLTATHYAMGASGYSTRLSGGKLKIGSDRTAFQVIGCTNKAGIRKSNSEANVRPGALLDVKAATTRVSTSSRNGVVTSKASNHIARVVLGPDASTAPVIHGITSVSRAYHNGSGFHSRTRTGVLDVTVAGVSLGVPTAGNPINIPGVASIALGRTSRSHGANGANAQAEALRVTLAATGQKIYLAHTRATIGGGVKSALFSGNAYGSKANVLNSTVKSGPTPLLVMPCQGTNGKVQTRSILHANPGNVGVRARGLSTSQSADATRTGATAYEKAHIAKVALGGGLVIKGINAKASVTKDRSGLHRSAKGTSVARVLLNGKRLAIPASGVLKIRGLAKIETKIVHQIKGGISVVAARVKLLDGRGATVTLASAKVKISPSGL
jgi:hypothetical protein